MVIWIIGLSGSGKSTVGKLVYETLRQKKPNTVFLDGDLLRRTISTDLGYSESDRRISEFRRSRLCHLLAEQGIQVVCAAISNCPDIRAWCRQNIPGYLEVYLKTTHAVLHRRDRKGLYQNAGPSRTPVVGVEIPFAEPSGADLTLEVTEASDPHTLARAVLSLTER